MNEWSIGVEHDVYHGVIYIYNYFIWIM